MTPSVEVTVVTATEAAEAVQAILDELRTGGLVEDRPAADRVRLRCYLPRSRLLPVTLRALRARVRGLSRFGLDPGSVRVASRPVAARRWATAWRMHARAVRVGRLLVRPPWLRAAPRRGDRVIEIDPGMAFGTGMHPSTRLCLRAMLRCLPARPGAEAPTVFDIGTGSGILAIAAARLGAARVWAVDSDPVAVAVARRNVRRNGVSRRVRVARRDGLDGASGQAGLILANIVAETIRELLPAVPGRLAAGGVFIGSGIIADRLPAVVRAAAGVGLGRMRVLAEGEWRAVALSRRDTGLSRRSRRRPLQTP